jgi:Fe-S cluster assembly protein SufD
MDNLSRQFAESLALESGAVAPSWLANLRARGAASFDANGLPGPGVERWKYTSLRPLERRAPRLGRPAAGLQSRAAPEPLVGSVPRVVLVNGDWSVLDGALPPGMTVRPLRQALEDGDAAVRRQVESLAFDDRSQGFSALNTATLGAGVYVHVDENADAGALLLQWLSAAHDELFNARVCVVLEAGARLELLEQFQDGTDQPPLLNVVVQCRLGVAAELRHLRLQEEPSKAVLVTRTELAQESASRYDYTGLDLGGGLLRHDIDVRLQGTGAACRLHGACVARDRTHVDHHLDVDHASPDCASSQLFRGILADRSRAVFNGRAHVAAGADGTEARQSSAALLLSPYAEIDAKPELEIHADEVVASHGATVGQLDEDALFYLRSRGLSLADARSLLTLAFCRSVLDGLPDGAARKAFAGRLEAALQGGRTDP